MLKWLKWIKAISALVSLDSGFNIFFRIGDAVDAQILTGDTTLAVAHNFIFGYWLCPIFFFSTLIFILCCVVEKFINDNNNNQSQSL
jgi:cytochrome b subunit of formate dehydrogenase